MWDVWLNTLSLIRDTYLTISQYLGLLKSAFDLKEFLLDVIMYRMEIVNTENVPVPSAEEEILSHDDNRELRASSVKRLRGATVPSKFSTSKTKRLIDIVLGATGLFFTGTIMILVGPLSWLSSRGSVFFYQQRVGIHGKEFTLVKIRSIRVQTTGEIWNLRTSDSDIRITTLGRMLRRTYIDELPQFWNVLKGDMSIVGPRPELPELERELSNINGAFRERVKVRPGITGMAQVQYWHAHSEREARRRINFDRLYIEKSSLTLDVKIILRTVLRVLRQRGT
jgi:lipopolysaccharide/colanic/teichoic acid biosynthesis glycosyltransferase